MAIVDDAVKKHDILNHDGFDKAMKMMKSASDGELFFITSYETGGQSVDFKRKYALCAAEIGRREAKRQSRLSYITAGSGLIGALIGGGLQLLF